MIPNTAGRRRLENGDRNGEEAITRNAVGKNQPKLEDCMAGPRDQQANSIDRIHYPNTCLKDGQCGSRQSRKIGMQPGR